MKTTSEVLIFAGAVIGCLSIGCRAAAAFPQQAPPPPPPVAAAAPPPDTPPPPPPARGRRMSPPPPPCAAPSQPVAAAQGVSASIRGKIRQFNYGPEGEVAGFVLSNGVQVNLGPNVGTQVASLVKLGSEMNVTGYRRQSASGRTVLDAESFTANGQTISMPTAPGALPPPPPPADDQPPAPPQP